MVNGPGAATRCDCASRQADVSLVIHADRSEIAPVVQELVRFAAQHILDEGKQMEIDLALQEAVANAVVHGCGGDASLEVKCWAAYQEGKGLLLVVNDPGPGFEPSEVPDPMQEANLTFDHGRGVYLIRQLMDDVHYQKNGSEIHMIKY